MAHLCATCELANSASWYDFEERIRNEYSGFRKAGGKAFIGFWIPHTIEEPEGHRAVHCSGFYSIIIGFGEGETSVTFYDEDGEFETLNIPWQEIDDSRLTTELTAYINQPWLEKTEANSVIIAARKVTDLLCNLDEDPTNAWFTSVDWIMEYESLEGDC